MPSRRLSIVVAPLLAFILALFHAQATSCFVTTSFTSRPSLSSIDALHARKQKKGQTGKGFGKEPVAFEKPRALEKVAEDLNVRAGQAVQQQQQPGAPVLTSVPNGSNAIPTIDDENIPVEERTKSLLRDKYGLRTREEQQAEEERLRQAAEQRQKLEQWKEQVERGEDFDIIQALPEPVLLFIDRFLKAGVAVCTTLFVLAGLAITVEAGSKATNNPLPENIDVFVTNVVEPNFTPGLLVLLGFSVSLGAFAALQLGSASSTYREDR
jgi:hypothetical protein